MLDRTSPSVMERVMLIVRRMMERRALAPTIGPDDDLREAGFSSLDIVNLMLSIENELDVKFPEREMTPANFRSIARIADLISGLPQ